MKKKSIKTFIKTHSATMILADMFLLMLTLTALPIILGFVGALFIMSIINGLYYGH